MEESPAGWDLFSPSGSPQAEQEAGRAAGRHSAAEPGPPRTDRVAPPAPGRAVPVWLPLLAVLVVQTLLSVRLLWADTAFQDEATYLWAGHLEWAGLLHGSSVPPFPTYFSGAPVIYPPLGALADSAGGLTGARLLSLAFMLGSTLLLWDLTRRLFGARAGVLRRGAVRPARPHAAPRGVRDLRRDVHVPARAGHLVRGRGRGGWRGDQPDGASAVWR